MTKPGYDHAQAACQAAIVALEGHGFALVGLSGLGDATYLAPNGSETAARIRVATYRHGHFRDAAEIVFLPRDAAYDETDIAAAVTEALAAYRAAEAEDTDEADLDAIAEMTPEQVAALLRR